MDRRLNQTLCSVAAGVWVGMPCVRAEAPVPPDAAARYTKEIEPLLDTYCYDCHGDGNHKGRLALDSFPDIAAMQHDREAWKRIRDYLGMKLMPPVDKEQPDEAARKQLIGWIDAAVFPVDAAHPDPGRVPLRRLNREEYRNTIHDLLGVDIEVEDLLPPDDSGYGFDNIGDVLTLSPVHVERYLAAAQRALKLAAHPGILPQPKQKIAGAEMEGPGQHSEQGCFLVETGEAVCNLDFPAPGRYRIEILACGTWGADVAPLMEFRVDGNLLETWSVRNLLDSPAAYAREITVEQKGRHRLGLTFPNDFQDKTLADPQRRDRNLMIKAVNVEGPLEGPSKPETQRPGQDDRAYALEALTRFARLAFRRPVAPAEIEHYLPLLDVARNHGQDVEQGIRLAFEAMLVSPSFIFREEPVESGEKADGLVAIDDYALASRLSFFLWSSMPDERLFELAATRQLRAHLDEEISRMLQSPKAARFVSNFGGQWLQLRNMASVARDDKIFPGFNQNLPADMRKETEMLLTDILQENRPVSTLLDADYTFINENLAKHYGIEGVKGKEFRKVSLVGTPRRGLLGQGSMLALTSYPTRTAPVLRGKYVLENLLDIAPPPPPPDIPQLGGGPHGKDKSLREQMEIHRKDAACASCHALMDPIGFGLENFDATGAWRDSENGRPIDTSGTLIDGASFANADEMRTLLVTRHAGEFQRTVASKLLTYALGRGLEWYDGPAVDAIVAKVSKDDGRFQTFIRAVVDSVPFQYRRSSKPS